ncbi:AAA family ATPase [uncultured Shewanella sp.]|uniref:AAA family ATPase n=1 Tax=uncultured Shewanella sp. TaxID=173975 RepID=UPI002629084E|nr:AAA family ATPase [uncultured Shewanella sp.]
MFDKKIDELAKECGSLEESMDFIYVQLSPSIDFSNTGRRGGKKHFSISIMQLLSVFRDLKLNLNKFSSHFTYVESEWRVLFSSYITNKVVNTLSAVQTLPLFGLINKVNHVVNGVDRQFSLKNMKLTEQGIDNVILYLESNLPHNINSDSKVGLVQGHNVIYYGAPGTGKSFEIDKLVTDTNSVRTVFHPDTQHSDFVGSLKPAMQGDNITYRFRPGPFCLALVKASQSPELPFYLVIEEINRASAAAVFGELFLLLDREQGRSKYNIDVSDPEMLAYLQRDAPNALVNNKLFIPSNLSLLATMNSSDQAVMPMDSAFKRRWQFKYKSIMSEDYPQGSIKIVTNEGDYEVSWEHFSKSINKLLSQLNIPEDRLLGPWFLSEDELENESKSRDAIANKLLMYLWEDVLRHTKKDVIFDINNSNVGINNFGQLLAAFYNGSVIFNQSLIDMLTPHFPKLAIDNVS